MQAFDKNNKALGEPELLDIEPAKAIEQLTKALARAEVKHIKIFTPTLEQRRKMRNMGMKPMKSVHRTSHK